MSHFGPGTPGPVSPPAHSSAPQEPCDGRRPQSPYSIYAKSVLGLRWSSAHGGNVASRRKREFTPDSQKDSSYWVKRRRNNEAARRSRQRRRMDEFLLETRAVELFRENEKLKATLSAVQCRFLEVAHGRDLFVDTFTPQGCPTQWLHRHASSRPPFQTSVMLPPAVRSANPTCEASQARRPDGVSGQAESTMHSRKCPNLAAQHLCPGGSPASSISVAPKETYLPSANDTPASVEYVWNRSNGSILAGKTLSLDGYLSGGTDLGTGCSLFQDGDALHCWHRVASPLRDSHSLSYKDNTHCVQGQDLETATKHKHPNGPNEGTSPRQQWGDPNPSMKHAAGVRMMNGLRGGAHCLPYKLRFKSSALQTHEH